MSGFGGLHLGVKVVARNPCPEHGFVHAETDACQKGFIGKSYKEYDMGIRAFSALLIANVFNAATTSDIKDTSNATHTISANTATSAVGIRAGSGVTTPVFSNYVIETPLTNSPAGTGLIAATVNNTITDNSTNGTFTITGTLTNGTAGNLTYGNIGIEVTAATFVYLVSHDQTNGASGYVVSASGTVAVTYTITVS